MNTTTIGLDIAKAPFPGSRHGYPREDLGDSAAEACRSLEVFCKPTALPHRDGGLCERASLGAEAFRAGAYRETDCAPVRQAVRKNEQERCTGCRSHLRSREPSEYAFCADEDGGAAVDARITSGAPRVCSGAHGAKQP